MSWKTKLLALALPALLLACATQGSRSPASENWQLKAQNLYQRFCRHRSWGAGCQDAEQSARRVGSKLQFEVFAAYINNMRTDRTFIFADQIEGFLSVSRKTQASFFVDLLNHCGRVARHLPHYISCHRRKAFWASSSQNTHQDKFVKFLWEVDDTKGRHISLEDRELGQVIRSIKNKDSLEFVQTHVENRPEFVFENQDLIRKLGTAKHEAAHSQLEKKLHTLSKKQLRLNNNLLDHLLRLDNHDYFKEYEMTQNLASYFENSSGPYLNDLFSDDLGEYLSKEEKMIAATLGPFIEDAAGKSQKTGYQIRQKFKEDRKLDTFGRLNLKDSFEKTSLRIALEDTVKEAYKEVDDFIERYVSSPKSNIQPAYYQDFFNGLMKEYFRRIDDEARFKILRAMMDLAEDASDIEKFDLFVKNSGPQFQKLLQTIAREKSLDPEFAKVLRSVENDLQEISRKDLESAFKETWGENWKEVVDLRNSGSLGWGTMAGTIRANYDEFWNGNFVPAVIRVLRPNIAEELKKEFLILMQMAPSLQRDPRLRGTVLEDLESLFIKLSKNSKDELIVQNTIKNQETALQKYQGLPEEIVGKALSTTNTRFRVPKILAGADGRTGVMVQELIEAQSFDDFFKENPSLQKETMEDLARLWTRESLFFSGFHHADLHAGNLLFRKGADGKVEVVIIDYGMAKTLDTETRSYFLRVARALQNGYKDDLNEFSVKALRGKNRWVDFETLNARFLEGNSQSIVDYMDFLLENKVELSEELLSFKRGMFLVDQLLENAGSTQSIESLAANAGEELLEIHQRNKFQSFNVRGYGDANPTPFTSEIIFDELKKRPLQTCAQGLQKLLLKKR